MLANHTSIGGLFGRTLKQYDRLRSRNAFLEQYRRENMFSDGLGEFDSARETVKGLQDEYKACEGPDYVNWGEQGERDGSMMGHGAGGSTKVESANP